MCRAWIWSKRVSYHPRIRNGLCVSEHNAKCSKLSKHTNEVIPKQCREKVHSGARLPCSMSLFNLMTYSITHNIPESGGFSSCSGWEWVTACSTMQDFFNSEALCNYWNSNLNIFNFTNKITLFNMMNYMQDSQWWGMFPVRVQTQLCNYERNSRSTRSLIWHVLSFSVK